MVYVLYAGPLVIHPTYLGTGIHQDKWIEASNHVLPMHKFIGTLSCHSPAPVSFPSCHINSSMQESRASFSDKCNDITLLSYYMLGWFSLLHFVLLLVLQTLKWDTGLINPFYMVDLSSSLHPSSAFIIIIKLNNIICWAIKRLSVACNAWYKWYKRVNQCLVCCCGP